MITIRHTHEDGTLIEGSSKGDGVYEIAKQHGFRWFPSISAIGIRGSRDKDAQEWRINAAAEALRAAGHQVTVEIDNQWRPTAEREADLAERADERADRYSERASSAAARASAAHQRVDAISRRFEMGQPILVGHHSEAGARRDQQRMDQGMRKAVDETATASRLADRAAGAVRNQAHRHDSRTTMRRIERLEVELRQWQRSGDSEKTRHNIDRLTEEIAHWRGVLAERAATGEFVPWGPDDFRKGDEVRVLGRWLPVRRVNKKSVSVPGAYGSALSGNDASWNETVTWDEVTGRRRDGWQLDKPNGEPLSVELAQKVGRWRDLLGQASRANSYDTDATMLRCNVGSARRLVHGLPSDAADGEVDVCEKAVTDFAARCDMVVAYVAVYDRLAGGERFADIATSIAPFGGSAQAWRMSDGPTVDESGPDPEPAPEPMLVVEPEAVGTYQPKLF